MIETPWGKLTVVDAHVHFFSHRFLELLGKQKDPPLTAQQAVESLGWELPAEDPVDFARRWVSELDKHGVDKACLIASLPGDESSVEAAVQAFPDRFFGAFMFNPLVPGASEQLKQILGRGHLRVVCLFPAMFGFSVKSKEVEEVLKIATDFPGTRVFVYCGVLTIGAREKLGLASPFDLSLANPLDLVPIARKYSTIKFIVPHFGAGLFREALILGDLCSNVYLDTSSSNRWVKYQPGGLTLVQVFKQALDVVGPGRLLFGTDSTFFPRGWQRAIFDQQVEALKEIGASREVARQIFGENYLNLMS